MDNIYDIKENEIKNIKQYLREKIKEKYNEKDEDANQIIDSYLDIFSEFSKMGIILEDIKMNDEDGATEYISLPKIIDYKDNNGNEYTHKELATLYKEKKKENIASTMNVNKDKINLTIKYRIRED